MWSKASQLLIDGKVITAPESTNSTSKTMWVSSATSALPHVVTTSKIGNGRYMCDSQCIGWKTRSICAHCLAAAENNGNLFEFLTWFRSSNLSKKDGNLTKAVYHGTYKHAGKKQPSRRKYGNAVHIPLDEKVDRIPLSNLSNTKDVPVIQRDHSYAKSLPTSLCGRSYDNQALRSPHAPLSGGRIVLNTGRLSKSSGAALSRRGSDSFGALNSGASVWSTLLVQHSLQ